MKVLRALSGAVLLAGCNSLPTLPAGSPRDAAYTLSGTVSQTVEGVSRPLAGRSVVLWIQQADSGRTQLETTDQNGRYVAQVPEARVFVSAWGDDGVQPCLASATVAKDTTLDVEVVPRGSAPTPPAAASPLITGFVYETTPQGRSPVRGAHISVDASWDVWVAGTRTDDAGRYFLCRVNTPVRMVVSAGGGYQDSWHSLTGTTDMVLDIELQRR